MTDPDQCIICLESLQPPAHQVEVKLEAPATLLDIPSFPKTEHQDEAHVFPPRAEIKAKIDNDNDGDDLVATLVGCDHVVHDRCIRSWAKNSNTCPICRTAFNKVSLSAEPNGPEIDSYTVEDKKQTQEFDLRQWLLDNPEDEAEEQDTPCPICLSSERPDILLLCDACDAAYHTHCVGLNHVPQGSWYCMECADLFAPTATNGLGSAASAPTTNNGHRRPFPRTRERQRRARRQARSVEWQGAWGRIAGRIFDATNIDLDNHEDDDALEVFRRSQREREREAREYQEWEQRLQIASQQGAREAFARNIPREIGERLDLPPVVEETPEERRAWGAFDRARHDSDQTSPTNNNNSSSGRRKRKARSTTASPREPAVEEPERKLKKPRTRRLPVLGEASSAAGPSGPLAPGAASASSPTSAAPPASTFASALESIGAPATTAGAADSGSPSATNGSAQTPPATATTEPSFLSSLLREVEMSAPSDDESVRNPFVNRNGAEPSSPVLSPAPSSHNSPRALSLTPPPFSRPTSPSTLSSYIEPVYPKANYSPPRNSGETSDSDSRPSRAANNDIRQPRPRRPRLSHRTSTSQSQPRNSSPTRPANSHMSLEDKEKVSSIVRAALKPHWRAKELSREQYEVINRDVSRKLYDGLRDPAAINDDMRKMWETKAAQEVARAVAELAAS